MKLLSQDEAAELGQPARRHRTAALMEAMRTARLRLRRHKPKLQVIDNPVHNGNLRDEGDDLHPAPALRAGHWIHLLDLPVHDNGDGGEN